MTTLLYKFTLSAAKFNAETTIAALIIWLVVVACAIGSISAQPFTARQRNFWIAVVALAPIIGLLAYLPFSFRREDLPQVFTMKRDRQKLENAAKRLGGRVP